MELACTCHYEFDPVGDSREKYYEQKLLLGLAWHLHGDGPDVKNGDDGSTVVIWRIRSMPLAADQTVGGTEIAAEQLEVGETCQNNFELLCGGLERRYSDQHGCRCCAGTLGDTGKFLVKD